MSNYRRLISYIYAYEGDVKGKNIGFAKIEARNGQCKISVNVKKVYVGGNDIGVYLLSSGEEIFLGNMFIRNGAGEFRGIVQVNNVENSGYTMDQCYGLTVHDVKDSWQCYTTIWEDAVAHAAEVTLKEAKASQEETPNYEPIIAEIEKEVNEQVILDEEVQQQSQVEQEEANLETEDVKTTAQNLVMEQAEAIAKEAVVESEPNEVPQNNLIGNSFLHYFNINPNSRAVGNQEPQTTAQEPQLSSGDLETTAAVQTEESFNQAESPVISEEKETVQPIGNQEELARLQREEEESGRTQNSWQTFRKMYPKIQAFDYERGCEIITIKPQDIGMLPRETWVYGNNSFLLHGFYNYRYLILAKLENPEGMPRYLLGVPGHYYSNEKYMASMFGFPNFVLSKQQPVGDGRFGYWYTDIKLGS